LKVVGVRLTLGISVLNLEAEFAQVFAQDDWCTDSEAIPLQFEMKPTLAPDEMESASYAVRGDDFHKGRFPLQGAAIDDETENGIFGDNYRGSSQSSAEAEIDFAAILPCTARLLLPEPVGAECLWNVSAARRSIVFFAGVPETEV
jgi:hypothetical protein